MKGQIGIISFWVAFGLASLYYILTSYSRSTVVIMAMFNISAGIFILEWSWNRMSRVRAVDEDRDSQFPAFRRTDVHTWVKWKFLPLAVSTIFIRMIISFGGLAVAGFVSWICRLG